ncbi:MAG: EAL domain-containing protein [Acidobacteriales bacterium]|nr:EAL domain-containing protein [Terriglobales bacterium]
MKTMLPGILANLGESFHADRVLVLEDHRHTRRAGIYLSHSWQRTSVPQVATEWFSRYPFSSPEVMEWLLPLGEGDHVTQTEGHTSGAVAELFRELELKSILIVPIMVAGEVWGGVGVDCCTAERKWTPVEIDLLKIVANLIGATILRDRYVTALQESEQRFRAVADTAQDALIVVNSQGVVRYWNRAAERILGYTSKQAVGKKIHEWLAPARYHDSAARGLREFATGGHGTSLGKTRELAAIREDGAEIAIELALAPMRIEGEWCAVGIVRDITARKQAEQRMVWLARNDVLTALPNRTAFVEEIQQAIEHYRREQTGFAVCYLDLDHFKDINDTLGHAAGDLLLKHLAERLRNTLRETDRVARFGGDEFAVLMTNLSDPTDGGIVAEKILSVTNQPFFINGAEVHCSATLGLATCEYECSDPEVLLAHADAALYHAKAEGRGTFRFFTAALHNEVRDRITLLAELREAIAKDQLFLMYQPQVDMESGALVGLEALVRWRHPERGLIPPAQFIPAAENSGLIISLGKWVLREACRQTRSWMNMGLHVPVIAVNVSPTQFKGPSDLAAEVAATLACFDLSPEFLEIELTETALMQASGRNSNVMQNLRERGVRIAIDDFGTGYSCLDYLRRFPASRIKIAQTFISEIAGNSGSAAITRAAIGLGRELSLSVIAEGVETEEQAALLTKWGCKEAQGYLFARPLHFGDVSTLLEIGRVTFAGRVPATEDRTLTSAVAL